MPAAQPVSAVKTALTGRTVLLHTDDAEAYRRHLAAYEKELRPVGPRETFLMQTIADTDWRLERIPALEMAIYARGRSEFAGQFEHEDTAHRPGLIELETHLKYEKQLRNLHLQESRLRRQREKDSAELRNLQKERQQRDAAEIEMAAKVYVAAQKDGKPFDPAANGFEFSIEDIKTYLEGVRASRIYRETLKAGFGSLATL